MEIHEVCSIFPAMSPQEFEALKEDIAENGVLMPVWTYQGKVIDGRNRVRAVEELDLGITYQTKEWRGNDPEELVSFVVSLNKCRRHLTISQLAICAARAKKFIAAQIKEEERERKREQKAEEKLEREEGTLVNSPKSKRERRARNARCEAAEIYGVGDCSVRDAEEILDEDPELAAQVERGEKTINKAIGELHGSVNGKPRRFTISHDPRLAIRQIIGHYYGEDLDILIYGLANWAGYKLVRKNDAAQ